MIANLYQQIIHVSYVNLTLKDVACISFVAGFAIGVGYVMKKFMDVKKDLENK